MNLTDSESFRKVIQGRNMSDMDLGDLLILSLSIFHSTSVLMEIYIPTYMFKRVTKL
jgi:hypothetical protein